MADSQLCATRLVGYQLIYDSNNHRQPNILRHYITACIGVLYKPKAGNSFPGINLYT